jgi:hypothetical protein
MRYAACLALAIVVGLWGTRVVFSGASGTGGHGGGHASHGSFTSGHSPGHSIGHSIGHLFGHHGKGVGSPTNRATASPNLAQQSSFNFVPETRFRRRAPGQPVVFFFPHRQYFGFSGCPIFGFPGNGFFGGKAFDCLDGSLKYPSSRGFSGPLFYGSPLCSESVAIDSTASLAQGSDPKALNDANNGSIERRTTLLQLRDGSMYALTDYWVEDDQLHYTTTYGGQNSVPLERIDFEKTIRLNVGRGMEFVLRPKPAQR